MCFHPIKIRNPALFFNKDIDKPYIEVPCGHCEQCASNRVNDLVTRSYYEWQRTRAKGGFCYFDTLTYAPQHVPMLLGTMTFSRDDLTKFFKRLRITLQRRGYMIYDKDKKPLLRYLVTTEYGEDQNFTQRPHYHILWFCNITNITLYSFYHIVRKTWQKGFNDKITDVMSHVINRLDGIRYVCKYLTKSNDYPERLQNLLNIYKDDPDKLALIFANIKNIKPFYRASVGFGSSILDVSIDQLNKYGVPLYTSQGLRFVSVPKYIKYKVYYDKVNHPKDEKKYLFKRNSNGIKYLIDNLDKVIDARTLLYQNALDNCTLLGNDSHIKEYVLSLLDGRSLRDFVIYKCVYKGHMFSDLAWFDYHEYYKLWLTFPRTALSPCKTKDMLNRYLSTHDHAIITDLSDVRWFAFDEIDSILDLLITHKNKLNEGMQINKKQTSERLHSISIRCGLVASHH